MEYPGKEKKLYGKLLNNYNPTISVITSFFNAGDTIWETYNSLYNQTYPYFEWIIVDDASTDKASLMQLKKLEKVDERIKVFYRQNNTGLSLARDYGVSQSNKCTKYLFIMDADDVIDKTMFECLYWTLETHKESSFAYTSIKHFGDADFIWNKFLTTDNEIKENSICGNAMIKKEDFNSVGGYNIKEKSMYEDWNLWLKLIRDGKIPIHVNAPLFWYRKRNESELSRANKNNKNAMKYVNETSLQIKKDTKIIQYPREGEKYSKVIDRSYMILPNYEKENKITIMLLVPWMVVGGSDLFNLELVKGLDKEKYKFIILTSMPGDNKLRSEFEKYADVYDMSSFIDTIDYINFADYIIKSRNVNLVFISNSNYGYYMIPYLKRKYPHIPFIDYIHALDVRDQRLGYGRCSYDVHSYLSKTFTCNNFTTKQVNEYFNLDAKTLYIGVDDERFDPLKFDQSKLKEKYNIPNGKKIISFVARLSEEKRPEMFIDIANKLISIRDDLFFVIAGDGPLFNKINNLKNNKIKMLGLINNTEEIYSISDITVNCSKSEGLALSTYESISMGVPVISSDVGGQSDLVDDQVGALIEYHPDPVKEVYIKDVEKYANEIIRVLDNLEKIKSNCRTKIQKKFNIKTMLKNIDKIFTDEIEKNEIVKRNNNSLIEYNLFLESFYNNYLNWSIIPYYMDTYGINYSNQNDFQKMNSSTRLHKMFRKFYPKLVRSYAVEDARYVANFLRMIIHFCGSIINVFIQLFILIKSFLLAIPRTLLLIYKLIKNK